MSRNRAVENLLAAERAPSDPSTLKLAQAKESAMPFAIRNLSVLAYAQGFTLWHYRAGAGRLAETRALGFFDAAANMFAVGDMLMISAIDGGTMVCVATAGQRVQVASMTDAAPVPMAAE